MGLAEAEVRVQDGVTVRVRQGRLRGGSSFPHGHLFKQVVSGFDHILSIFKVRTSTGVESVYYFLRPGGSCAGNWNQKERLVHGARVVRRASQKGAVLKEFSPL